VRMTDTLEKVEVITSRQRPRRRRAADCGQRGRVLLPLKDRAGQVVMMVRMNCLGDLYPRAR